MQRRIRLSFAILGCVASSAAFADFRADFAQVQGNGEHALARIELSGAHLRVDSGNVSMLVDTGSGSKIVLMHDKHQYMDMARMAQQMEAMLANVPPQMQEMMKQRMGTHNVAVSFTPSGKIDSVGGRACKIYSAVVDGRHSSDACIAEVGAAGISETDGATLHRAFEQMQAMASKASAGMVRTSIDALPAGTFPLRIVQYGSDGAVSEVSELKQLSATAIPASDFAIPAGYSEMQMPAFGAHH